MIRPLIKYVKVLILRRTGGQVYLICFGKRYWIDRCNRRWSYLKFFLISKKGEENRKCIKYSKKYWALLEIYLFIYSIHSIDQYLFIFGHLRLMNLGPFSGARLNSFSIIWCVPHKCFSVLQKNKRKKKGKRTNDNKRFISPSLILRMTLLFAYDYGKLNKFTHKCFYLTFAKVFFFFFL